eukprot:4602009-Pyramimonas_sp.AAC.1
MRAAASESTYQYSERSESRQLTSGSSGVSIVHGRPPIGTLRSRPKRVSTPPRVLSVSYTHLRAHETGAYL